MNNKGFTLIEVLAVLILISLATVIAVSNFSSSMSLGKKEAYSIMKNNLISAGYTYIEECEEGLLRCDFSFSEKNTFPAKVLEESGYFKSLKSPLDGKYLGECLTLNAKKENGVVVIDMVDKCYL